MRAVAVAAVIPQAIKRARVWQHTDMQLLHAPNQWLQIQQTVTECRHVSHPIITALNQQERQSADTI
jgi:hypothetical protein